MKTAIIPSITQVTYDLGNLLPVMARGFREIAEQCGTGFDGAHNYRSHLRAIGREEYYYTVGDGKNMQTMRFINMRIADNAFHVDYEQVSIAPTLLCFTAEALAQELHYMGYVVGSHENGVQAHKAGKALHWLSRNVDEGGWNYHRTIDGETHYTHIKPTGETIEEDANILARIVQDSEQAGKAYTGDVITMPLMTEY